MSFYSSESGAVTVDWVVLTAALVGLGLAAMAVVASGVEDASGDVDAELKSDFIIATAFYDARFASIANAEGGEVWPRCSGDNICEPHVRYEAELTSSTGDIYRLAITDPIDSNGPGYPTIEVLDQAWQPVDIEAVDFGSVDCADYTSSDDGSITEICISDFN